MEINKESPVNKSNPLLAAFGAFGSQLSALFRSNDSQKLEIADTGIELAALGRFSDNEAEKKLYANSILELHKGLAAITVAELRREDSSNLWTALIGRRSEIRAQQIEPVIRQYGKIPLDEISSELEMMRFDLEIDYENVLAKIDGFIKENEIQTIFGIDDSGIQIAALIWTLAKEKNPDLQLGLLSSAEEEFWINGSQITPRQYRSDNIDYSKGTLGFGDENSFQTREALQRALPDSIVVTSWANGLDQADITISSIIGSSKVRLPRAGALSPGKIIAEDEYLNK